MVEVQTSELSALNGGGTKCDVASGIAAGLTIIGLVTGAAPVAAAGTVLGLVLFVVC